MQTFLEETARYLLLNHNTGLADVCVVFPNRRAGIYLKKYISDVAQQTLWAPDIFSIEDFLTQLSGFTKLDTVALTFELYEVHKQIEKDKHQEFEQFSKWGQMMLADFNEIDMHLADAKALFGYLSEIKAIEKWNPDGRPLTLAEREYLSFFNSLYAYYSEFNARLKANKNASQGMIYRFASENIEALIIEKKWKKIYFAGFNALTKAEERVIYFLRDTLHAEILRDADAYYLNDEKQEAGEFLRKQLLTEGRNKFGEIRNFFAESSKEIYIHGVPRNEGQAIIAGKILQKWINNENQIKPGSNKTNLSNTAVVLADEGLLIPVLNALPKNLDAFNVTMGYPLKLTPAFNLIMLILRMFENTERFRKMKDENGGGFYHRDILRLLQHSMMAGTYNTQFAIFKLRKSKQVFYNFEEIEKTFFENDKNQPSDKFRQLIEIVFSNPYPTSSVLLQILSDIITHFRQTFQDQEKNKSYNLPLQTEFLYHAGIIIKRLKDLNKTYNSFGSVKTIREIFRQISTVSHLPFTGEPLRGIQIMGMLETRNLDFEKVILLSANEGILPSSASGNSLIPFDIQLEMKLPTHNQKNAVFAYHFYRLLQRASEVHIIYNTESGTMGGGEKSRFVHQIINELPDYNPEIKIFEGVENLPPPHKIPDKIIEIEKSDTVFQTLLEKAASGFSPTSLNQYRKCPLQFYFKNLAQLREVDQVEENLEYKTIGSIVHSVLEDSFTPFSKKLIASADVRTMHNNIDALISKAFEKHYAHGQVKFGKNRLIFEVIRSYLHAFLNAEEQYIGDLEKQNRSIHILDLEEEFVSENLASNFPGIENSDIRIKGVIDRIDKVDDTIRIIDYKTGMVKNTSDLQIVEWDDFSQGHKKDKPFQILLYAWLYSRTRFIDGQQLKAGIFSLPIMSNGLMKFGKKANVRAAPDEIIDDEKLEHFEQYLLTVLDEIFDKEIPFNQTLEKDTCKLCDYKGICRR